MRTDLAALAAVVDSSVRPPDATGYVAEFHGLLNDTVLVWAPCGCQLVVHTASGSVLTGCNSPTCDFSWAEAVNAVAALDKAVVSEPKLEIVKVQP